MPKSTFGIKPNKPGFFYEGYKDFQGKDSPPLNIYTPKLSSILKSAPKFS